MVVRPHAVILALLSAALFGVSTPGADNNLTRKVSLANPLEIVELKGPALGFRAGGSLPALSPLPRRPRWLLMGVSLALFIPRASTSWNRENVCVLLNGSFLRTMAAVIFLKEPVKMQLSWAGLLMASESGCA